MKTGFVIVNYNDYETTVKLLDNILCYKVLDEIVVVDNCSTDDSYGKLSKLKNEKVTIIKSDANRGYAAGLNFGGKYLIDKYGECNIIFSNADIVIEKEEDLKKILETLNSDDSYGIVAPIVREHTGFNRGWRVPSPMQDALLNIAYIHRYLRPKMLFYKDEYYKNNTNVFVEVVSGSFFCMKSSCLVDVKYFDENTFLYYEENIIARKLQSKGYNTVIRCDTEVFHNHSVTIDKSIRRIKKYKLLKQSQRYFQKTYNHANAAESCLLYITYKMTLVVLYMISWINNLKIKKPK